MNEAALTVLIVNYNGGAMLGRCVASLDRDPVTAAAPVVLVDNASSDGSAEAVAAECPRVRLLSLGENRGFGAGNNAGLAECDTPYVLIANPDTEIRDGSVEEVLGHMESSPRIGLVGCRLLGEDGTLQWSIRNSPTVLREAYECLFLHRMLPGTASRWGETVRERDAYDRRGSWDWVCGASMLARTDALREVGGFDEGFFLYAEETDLCKRLRDAGWEVGYDPALTMLHVGGTYTVDAFLSLENQRSKLRYFLKHEGRPAVLGLAAVISARLLIRGLLYAAAAFVRREPRLRQRAVATLRTLRRYPKLVGQFLTAPRPVTVSVVSNEGEAV